TGSAASAAISPQRPAKRRTAASGRARAAGGALGGIVVVSMAPCGVSGGVRMHAWVGLHLIAVVGGGTPPTTIVALADGLRGRERLEEDGLAVGSDLVQAVGLQRGVAVGVEPVGAEHRLTILGR